MAVAFNAPRIASGLGNVLVATGPSVTEAGSAGVLGKATTAGSVRGSSGPTSIPQCPDIALLALLPRGSDAWLSCS